MISHGNVISEAHGQYRPPPARKCHTDARSDTSTNTNPAASGKGSNAFNESHAAKNRITETDRKMMDLHDILSEEELKVAQAVDKSVDQHLAVTRPPQTSSLCRATLTEKHVQQIAAGVDEDSGQVVRGKSARDMNAVVTKIYQTKL